MIYFWILRDQRSKIGKNQRSIQVVVVSSLCCGLGGGGARGAAGADVKAAGTAPKSDEAAVSVHGNENSEIEVSGAGNFF